MNYLLLIVGLTISLIGTGQDFFCSSPEMNKRAEKLNPIAKQSKEQLELFTKKFEQEYDKNKGKTTYIIPVVFHVVHNYGAENISKEQILDAIRIINEDFQKMNADTANIIPEFKAISANCNIEFRLAKVDPNGNCTDGIVRVVSPLTYNANENTKLAAPSWDRTKYLNIWTVASIESGAAGYAYYPSSVNGSWGVPYDGILILASYVGSIGTSTISHAHVLTHEIGHYLNLMHPWGDSNNPGLAENCNDDDQVNDTPNTIGHTSCNLYAVTCGSLDNVQNFMEYSYCYCMFTEGQKIRMHAALNSSISGRNNLWTTQNLIATGVHDSYTPQICAPIADFTYSRTFGCNHTSIQFFNSTWNTDSISQLNWNFPGGQPSTSNALNPVVLYPQGGIYSVSLTASNPSGTNTITKQNIIQILDSSVAYSLPWFEGFENPQFPQSNDANFHWFTKGTGANPWQRTTICSYEGTACLIAPTHLNNNESQIEIYSPNIFISGQDPQNVIRFKLAYAQRDENSTDKLQIFVSFNCGESWYPRLSKSGSILQTTNGNYYFNFVPTQSQWREEYISIGTFINRPFIRLKIVATSGNGNPIYLDNFQLEKITSLAVNEFDNLYLPIVFPNPLTNESALWIKINKTEQLHLSLTDAIGKRILSKIIELNEGEHQLPVFSDLSLAQGIYFLHLQINDKQTTIKLVVP